MRGGVQLGFTTDPKESIAEVIRYLNHDHKNQPFVVEASSTIDTISDKVVKI